MEYREILGWIGGVIGAVWGAIQIGDWSAVGGFGIVGVLVGALIGAIIDKASK
jgi:hypothetical protein